MAVEVILPRVDMDMTEGKFAGWRAAEGDHVVKGQLLFEIETDKAAMEVEAPATGVLRWLRAKPDDVLPVGSRIAWIVADGEDFIPPPEADARHPRASGDPEVKVSAAPLDPGLRGDDAPGRRATPYARRLAREHGLALDAIPGSGPRGRIQRSDVEAAIPAPSLKQAGGLHRLWLQRAQGLPLVFLHGFGADLNGWRPLHRHLPATLPALALDLPGHGESPLGEASFAALVEAARATLAQEGVTRAHLIGHSLGGAVAAALSARADFEAASLMLIAPAGLGGEENRAFIEGFLAADSEAALTPWMHCLVADPASLGSALVKTTLRQRADGRLVAAQRSLAEALFPRGRQAFSIRDALAKLTCPAKIVIGLEDRIIAPRHAEDVGPLIALHRFPSVGHMPHFEARRDVARLVEELARAGT
jgi:pyruvate dehydrogenase E2 component (dihydrolipoamide acetyltransferase)